MFAIAIVAIALFDTQLVFLERPIVIHHAGIVGILDGTVICHSWTIQARNQPHGTSLRGMRSRTGLAISGYCQLPLVALQFH